jgi:tetratricopeptide (TPR) repeat protein
MSGAFEIVGEVILLIIGLGCTGWLFLRALKRSEDPSQQVFKLVFSVGLVVGEVLLIRKTSGGLGTGMAADFGSALVMAGSVAISGIILGIMWTPQISALLARPLTSAFDGGDEPPEPKPYYSIAQTKRKLDKPLEAIVEIRKQLAKFPNDYEGVILLASIQAEDTKDLPSAEITLNRFCDSSGAPPKQVAAALTQMADWHLKIAQDSDSARVVLGKIIARFPETGLALQAAQRSAHLGGAQKILMAAHDRQRVSVPEGVKNIGLLDSSEHLIPVEADPEKLAADFVKHLDQHPLDTEAREELAIIYARHYKRLDLATLELTQLIEQPNQPHKRVAHWLNLLADLQVQGGADYDTVRGTLEKIVESFPDLPVAEIAQSRLSRLKLEFKGKEETPGIKLGVYEQNIGLKYGSPRQL